MSATSAETQDDEQSDNGDKIVEPPDTDIVTKKLFALMSLRAHINV